MLPFNRGGRRVFFTGNNVTYRVARDIRANQHWKDMKFKSKLSVKRANAAAEFLLSLFGNPYRPYKLSPSFSIIHYGCPAIVPLYNWVYRTWEKLPSSLFIRNFLLKLNDRMERDESYTLDVCDEGSVANGFSFPLSLRAEWDENFRTFWLRFHCLSFWAINDLLSCMLTFFNAKLTTWTFVFSNRTH